MLAEIDNARNLIENRTRRKIVKNKLWTRNITLTEICKPTLMLPLQESISSDTESSLVILASTGKVCHNSPCFEQNV